jgi:hypothetical protein
MVHHICALNILIPGFMDVGAERGIVKAVVLKRSYPYS